MKEVWSLTTTQEKILPRANPLDKLVCFADTYPRIWFINQIAFFPFFDQLGPVPIWSILNCEVCSNKDIGSAIEICPDLLLSKKWSLGTNWLIGAQAYPHFCSMRQLEVFVLPLDRMPVHHRSLPSNLWGFPNNMSVPILTFSLKFSVSETSTNRVYVNQFYCNRIYTQEKLQDSNYMLEMDS